MVLYTESEQNFAEEYLGDISGLLRAFQHQSECCFVILFPDKTENRFKAFWRYFHYFQSYISEDFFQMRNKIYSWE